jgi:hypothetical protein
MQWTALGRLKYLHGYPAAYTELVQELTARLDGAIYRAGTTLSLARISIRAKARFNLVI